MNTHISLYRKSLVERTKSRRNHQNMKTLGITKSLYNERGERKRERYQDASERGRERYQKAKRRRTGNRRVRRRRR
jgi:hypothetical protein